MKNVDEIGIMDDIKQWLNGSQDWHTGVDLVLKYSTNRLLHQVFLEGRTPYKESRLKKELTALLNAKVVQTVVQQKAKQTVVQIIEQEQPIPHPGTGGPSVFTKGWGHTSHMDDVTRSLHLQWKPLFLEMTNLMSRLYDVAKQGLTDKAAQMEAGRMAHRILDLDDLLDDIYQKRDTYKQTGALPVKQDQPDDFVVDPKKWPKALENHKRYVRDYRAKLKKDPTNEGLAAQLKKHETRVEHYQKLLNE